jgi:hypothetical protein
MEDEIKQLLQKEADALKEETEKREAIEASYKELEERIADSIKD